MSDDECKSDQMRFALSAIANEMQKFHNETLTSNEELQTKGLTSQEISSALVKCKSNLKLKKSQTALLKHNLQIACAVAKTLSAAKETETTSLNNILKYTRNQYRNLEKEHTVKVKLISTLQADNEILRDKLECFNNLIHIGYNGLQNIRTETLQDDLPVLKKLQKIIICCGQYYADCCNQREKCTQLEQKNRFLTSKLRIIESQHIPLKELRNFSDDGIFHRKNGLALTKSQNCTNIGVVRSECQLDRNSSITNLTMTKIELKRQSIPDDLKNFDLTCHLSTVKRLLHDQDTMLKSLKSLSKEVKLNVESFLA